MKAIVVASTLGVLIKLEDGTEYAAEKPYNLEHFKEAVADSIDMELGKKVEFETVDYTEEPTEHLERLCDESRTHGIEKSAIVEELVRRGVIEEEEGILAKAYKEVNLDDLNQYLAALDDDFAAMVSAEEDVKESKNNSVDLVKQAKDEVAELINSAKTSFELIKLEAEEAIDEAEAQYKEARRVVSINNLGANEVEKSEEEKQGDFEKMQDCKEKLDKISKEVEAKVEAAKEHYEQVKEDNKDVVSTTKENCLLALKEAKSDLTDSQVAYFDSMDKVRNKVTKATEQAAENVEASKVRLEELKNQLEQEKETLLVRKGILSEAKKILKRIPTKKTKPSNTSLKEAEAEKEEAGKNVGEIVFFVPGNSNEPIKGEIKFVTIDKRVNKAYYQLQDEEGKSYRVRVERLNVEACRIATTCDEEE